MTLNRPERMNALDALGHRELTEVWPLIDRDPGVNAVVLCGAGQTFSTGGDFEMVEAIIDDFDARARTRREARDALLAMGFDAIVLATGSTPSRDGRSSFHDGDERFDADRAADRVFTTWDAMSAVTRSMAVE